MIYGCLAEAFGYDIVFIISVLFFGVVSGKIEMTEYHKRALTIGVADKDTAFLRLF